METHGLANDYQHANQMYNKRTDWDKLKTKQCKCGQKFKTEIGGQTQCRDCHSAKETGFYAPGVKPSYHFESFIEKVSDRLKLSKSLLQASTNVLEDAVSLIDVPDEDEPEEELSGRKEEIVISPEYKTWKVKLPY